VCQHRRSHSYENGVRIHHCESQTPKAPVNRVDGTMVELSLALVYQWAGRLMLSLYWNIP
jgi:hypothetical protein